MHMQLRGEWMPMWLSLLWSANTYKYSIVVLWTRELRQPTDIPQVLVIVGDMHAYNNQIRLLPVRMWRHWQKVLTHMHNYSFEAASIGTGQLR